MKAGQYITDGTAIFILDDVRDGNRVGDIVLKPTLNDGYIKANGATVKASEYPRLLKFVQDNNLCVSDSDWSANMATKYIYDASADTLKVPNVMNRVLQGAEMLATREAGLPNITGMIGDSHDDIGLFWELAGAFYGDNAGNTGHKRAYFESHGNNSSPSGETRFDASRSNHIYGASSTVQPPSCCLIAQIKY